MLAEPAGVLEDIVGAEQNKTGMNLLARSLHAKTV